MRRFLVLSLCALGLTLPAVVMNAQFGRPTPRPRSSPVPQMRGQPVAYQTMRKPADMIKRQEPMKVNQSLLGQANPGNTHIVVSIPKQRAYLMIGDKIVADAPVSSGKRGHSTPTGHFSVLEKDPNHHSTLYGDFVDGRGRVVRAGVSARIDSAPSGTHFEGAAMKWFLRLTSDGVGMHIGFLPGYPASHGCVRESVEGAKLFYDHARVGTPVDVGDY